MPSYFRPWYVNQGWDVGMFWLAVLSLVIVLPIVMCRALCCGHKKVKTT